MIWNPGDGSALNKGSAGNDSVELIGGNVSETFTAAANGNRVRFDRFTPLPFSLDIGTSENLVLNASGDDDSFTASDDLAPLIRSTVDGGAGNDVLTTGAGHDVLLGGAGEDLLSGGSGRDLLIGGVGGDRIVGNADDDILIAGSTVHDSSDTALCAIMHEWTSSRTYSQRIANLSNQTVSGTDGSTFGSRANGNYYLWSDGQAGTVLDDNAADVLTGSSGLDWFLFNADGNGTARDRASSAEIGYDLASPSLLEKMTKATTHKDSWPFLMCALLDLNQ